MTYEHIWRELMRNLVRREQPKWYADGSVRVITDVLPPERRDARARVREALAAAIEADGIEVAFARDGRDLQLQFGDEVRLVVRGGGALGRQAAAASLERA
jgi:hypothetical protein